MQNKLIFYLNYLLCPSAQLSLHCLHRHSSEGEELERVQHELSLMRTFELLLTADSCKSSVAKSNLVVSHFTLICVHLLSFK